MEGSWSHEGQPVAPGRQTGFRAGQWGRARLQAPAHSRDPSARLGARAHCPQCQNLQRLFCQEAERLHECFITDAMWCPRGTAGGSLQGAGSPCRKQDCEIWKRRGQEQRVGVLASAISRLDSSHPVVPLALPATHPVSGDKTFLCKDRRPGSLPLSLHSKAPTTHPTQPRPMATETRLWLGGGVPASHCRGLRGWSQQPTAPWFPVFPAGYSGQG